MEEKTTNLMEKLKIYIKFPLKRVADGIKTPNVKKRVAALAMATGILVAPLSACSCANTNANNASSTPTISSNIDSSATDSSTQTPENAYSEYSKILQTVMTDSYYTNLVDVAETKYNQGDKYYAKNNNTYMQIPYGFLKQQGYNIDAIKNNQLECISDVYTRGNDLYIELKVEHKSSIDYFANYLIKYTLTNQELEDLTLLNSATSRPYYQAPQFIQELSYQKNAELLSVQYWEKQYQQLSEQQILNYILNSGKVNASGFEKSVTLTSILVDYRQDEDKDSEYVKLYVHTPTYSIKNQTIVTTAIICPMPLLGAVVDGNFVIRNDLPTPIIWDTEKLIFNNSKFTATFYNSYNSTLDDILDYKTLTK